LDATIIDVHLPQDWVTTLDVVRGSYQNAPYDPAKPPPRYSVSIAEEPRIEVLPSDQAAP
jgi:hypothetical protein